MMDLILIELANIAAFAVGLFFGFCKWTSKL